MSSPFAWLRPPEYRQLPAGFSHPQRPAPVAAPQLLHWNAGLAERLGMPAVEPAQIARLLAGLDGPSPPSGLATAYAGHQFGHFVPQLGDGRALLLGDIVSPDGARFELQLKGSGRTPFSRGGDGRAALGPVLREVLVSEAMHALGVPTTRSLAAIASGELVQRERPLPGGVLARLASSHVRVGSFEYFACRRDIASLQALSDWVICRHYPHCQEAERPALALLQAVIERQAELIAHWMSVGFIHGVMNTDNMALSGETIDYGPCAFLDEYNPNKVFSSIDQQGRYAYSNQPGIAQWNLARLAECLLPLIDADEAAGIELASTAVQAFVPAFEAAWLARMRPKFGLDTAQPGDSELIEHFLAALHEIEADYTRSFSALADRCGSEQAGVMATLPRTPAMDRWCPAWQARLSAEQCDVDAIRTRLRRANPAVIPRNHQIERVIAAAYADDMQPFDELLAALCRPFDDGPAQQRFMQPPEVEQRVEKTFCGT
ncbi:protein adenylyltransferase SelO [Pseudomarimonas arenosa]|uniref:Protein nucleotidyltransferase YdiU n=1 Tax=Pseudomarimonas arenosa TaxID=2774145 RepID=A0AAW3ZQ82_9GAMM|nr:YdiU family protein [Pseudomarimonas arenosa]MBD8527644.1 YdiU family protein [Pseudomarimonas arenosa]